MQLFVISGVMDSFWILFYHGLRTPREEIAFTARPKLQSQSQFFYLGVMHILSATLAQFFRYLWFMPSLGVRSPCCNAKHFKNSIHYLQYLHFIFDQDIMLNELNKNLFCSASTCLAKRSQFIFLISISENILFFLTWSCGSWNHQRVSKK